MKIMRYLNTKNLNFFHLYYKKFCCLHIKVDSLFNICASNAFERVSLSGAQK